MGFQRLITPAERRRARLLGVVAAALVAQAARVLAELALGLRLQPPAGTASPEPVDLPPLTIALASAPLYRTSPQRRAHPAQRASAVAHGEAA